MRTGDFDYDLPAELIAQTPALERDQSRLLVLERATGRIEHHGFRGLLTRLQAGDVLVLNNSRVIPARLRGANAETGGQFELLLTEENGTNDWWVMMRPGRRARVGTTIVIRDAQQRPTAVKATVLNTHPDGRRRLRFAGVPNVVDALEVLGETPLPPYIGRPEASQCVLDRERYQTVYAKPPGSVAAPTAGLHFTPQLIEQIRARGVPVCFLTLHVGLGTFAPVKAETLSAHTLHEERYNLPAVAVDTINAAKRAGKRVVAVGTTTVRVLETVAARHGGRLVSKTGTTRMFIYPPYNFRVVDALLTNFHLPRSTLLMLVSAFAAPCETRGCELILGAYAEAIREQYRFFSYGDAMLIW